MSKRYVILLVAAFLVAAVLTGCSNAEEALTAEDTALVEDSGSEEAFPSAGENKPSAGETPYSWGVSSD